MIRARTRTDRTTSRKPCAHNRALSKGSPMKMKFAVAAFAATLSFAAFAPALAADGDPAAGKTAFNQCRACHQVGPSAKNSVGPILNGIVGRKAGEEEGYNYSDANKSSGITWDEATLREYLQNPRAKIPGTKMVFPGIKREKQLDDLIAYLKGIKADGSGA
jgi:cytochrome c